MRPDIDIDDETDAERHSRLGRCLRRMTDSGLALALAYADRATAELQATPDPAAKPGPSANAVAFERFSRLVRLLVTLETKHAAAGKPGKAEKSETPGDAPAPPPDTRREPIREHFRELTTRHPDRSKLRRKLDAAVDALLVEDPEHRRVPAEFIARVAKEFGLPFDVAAIPDSLLFHPHQMPKLRYEHERSGRPPPPEPGQ